jgi:N-glycosylase/DNA lyase
VRTAPPAVALHRAVQYAAAEFGKRRTIKRPVDEAWAWRELVACLIGGASRYEHAAAASQSICLNLPAPWTITASELGTLRSRVERGDIPVPTRFPRAHSHYILAAIDSIYVNGDGLCSLIADHATPPVARATLVQALQGIGPKQASLLLLNLGVTDDLAVLDRHILRYMGWIGLRSNEQPPRSLREYEGIEDDFRSHCRLLGHAMIDVDRAVWLTSRIWSGKPS